MRWPKASGKIRDRGWSHMVTRSLPFHTSAVAPIHSIAVLPFANASNNSEMDYLSEGLSKRSPTLFPGFAVSVMLWVTIYVAASDPVPEVNKEPGARMALLVFVGAGFMFLLDTLFHVLRIEKNESPRFRRLD